MDKKIKAKWLKALRSGQYTQGKGYLKKNSRGVTRFCCLGVLRDVCPTLRKQPGEALLHYKDARQIGLHMGRQMKLASMNDGDGCDPKTFKEIADYIQKQL